VSERNYWISIFNETTWQEFLAAGANVAGFSESRYSLVQQIQPGDYLLCYLTKFSRWIGILKVISTPFMDRTRIWKNGAFPCRVNVEVVIELTLETAVPVLEMKDKLTVFQNLVKPTIWSGAFRVSPFLWKGVDGEAVVEAVHEASRNPVVRPLGKKKHLINSLKITRFAISLSSYSSF
jgi:predicted RNA-binding protein